MILTLNIAKLFSTIFSPFIVLSAVLVFVLFYFYNSFVNNLPSALVSLFFAVIVPVFTIVWLFRHKLIKDIHLNTQSDRQIPLLVCITSAVAGLVFLVLIGSPKYLLAVNLMFIFNCLTIFLITFFWKISVHSATYSAAATVALFVVGPAWWFLFLGLIIVGWARVYEKKHTVLQVVAGALLSFLITVIVFNIFDFTIFR